jgi:dienelactone hydrolase
MACPDCVSGTLHTGTPTGTIETIHGLPTYIAQAPGTTPRGTIVIIPDAFGWDFNNNRILADSYASKGPFRVLLPDFMAGWSVTPDALPLMDYIMEPRASFGVHTFWKAVYVLRAASIMIPFLITSNPKATYPRVLDYFTKLYAEEGDEKPIFAAGFCWGGKHVFWLAADANKTNNGKSLITAAFTAHPSFMDIPKDPDAVKLPMCVALAEKDHGLNGEKITQLEAGLKACPAECEVKLYEGATHGK